MLGEQGIKVLSRTESQNDDGILTIRIKIHGQRVAGEASIKDETRRMLNMEAIGVGGSLQQMVLKGTPPPRPRTESDFHDEGKATKLARHLHYFPMDPEEARQSAGIKSPIGGASRAKYFRDDDHLVRIVLMEVRNLVSQSLQDLFISLPEDYHVATRLVHQARLSSLISLALPNQVAAFPSAAQMLRYVIEPEATGPVPLFVVGGWAGSGLSTMAGLFFQALYAEPPAGKLADLLRPDIFEIKGALQLPATCPPAGRLERPESQLSRTGGQITPTPKTPASAKTASVPMTDSRRSGRTLSREVVTLEHVVGVNTQSADVIGFYRRVMRKIKFFCGLSQPVPSSISEIAAALPVFLQGFSSADTSIARLIIYVDGFEKFEAPPGYSEAPMLFPPMLPPRVRVILSSATTAAPPKPLSTAAHKPPPAGSPLPPALNDIVVKNSLPVHWTAASGLPLPPSPAAMTLILKVAGVLASQCDIEGEVSQGALETLMPSVGTVAEAKAILLCAASASQSGTIVPKMRERVPSGYDSPLLNSADDYGSGIHGSNQGTTSPYPQSPGKFLLRQGSGASPARFTRAVPASLNLDREGEDRDDRDDDVMSLKSTGSRRTISRKKTVTHVTLNAVFEPFSSLSLSPAGKGQRNPQVPASQRWEKVVTSSLMEEVLSRLSEAIDQSGQSLDDCIWDSVLSSLMAAASATGGAAMAAAVQTGLACLACCKTGLLPAELSEVSGIHSDEAYESFINLLLSHGIILPPADPDSDTRTRAGGSLAEQPLGSGNLSISSFNINAPAAVAPAGAGPRVIEWPLGPVINPEKHLARLFPGANVRKPSRAAPSGVASNPQSLTPASAAAAGSGNFNSSGSNSFPITGSSSIGSVSATPNNTPYFYAAVGLDLLNLSSPSLRRAVKRLLFADESDVVRVHARLAALFEKARFLYVGYITPRVIDELPFAAAHAHQWFTLRHCLVDMDTYRLLAEERYVHESKRYWDMLNEAEARILGPRKVSQPAPLLVEDSTEDETE